MKRQRWLWLVAVVGIGGVALALWFALNPGRSADTAVVHRGTIEATVDALGQVQPMRVLDLSTRVSGRVIEVAVRGGDEVAAGQVLLRVDDSAQQDALQQAEWNLQISQDTLDQALAAPDSADIEIARLRLRRATAARIQAQREYDDIADQPDAESSDEALALESAKIEYESAQADMDRLMTGTSEAQLRRLRINVEQAELAVEQAREHLEDTIVRAPYTGTVLSVEAHEGENVYAYNPLVSLADLDRLEITCEIDEIDIAQVAVGQTAHIRLDAFPGEVLTGTVAQVQPGPSDTRGSVTYEARIAFERGDLALRPGMGADVTITTQLHAGVLLVPRRAVRQVGRYQVVRVVEGTRHREVIVVTGLSNDDEIEVLTGLEEDQVVILE